MPLLNQNTVASSVLEIIRPLMSIIAAEMRRTKYALVPTQLGVLTALSDHPCNLSKLAELHAVSLPTMSNMISKMVHHGWVRRSRSEQDRRMLLIEVTPEGRAVLEEMGLRLHSRLDQLLSSLTIEEEQTVLAGLNILGQVLAGPARLANVEPNSPI